MLFSAVIGLYGENPRALWRDFPLGFRRCGDSKADRWFVTLLQSTLGHRSSRTQETMHLLSVILVCVAVAGTRAQGYNRFSFNTGGNQNQARNCRTPNGGSGQCVTVQQCPAIYNILQQQGLRREVAQLLNQLNCGFNGRESFICCASNPDTVGPRPTPRPSQRVTTPPSRRPTGSWNPLPTPSRQTDSSPGDFTGHPSASLLPSTCGEMQYVNKIVGGTVTELGEFPWLVILQYRDLKKPSRTVSLCGGVLISKRYVLTAAHCIYGDPDRYALVSILAGEHDTSTNPDCDKESCADPPQTVAVEKQIMHPSYQFRDRNKLNDVGLLRLQADVKFNFYVNAICLPLTSETGVVAMGDFLTVAGWGKTETNRTGSPIKLKVEVPAMDLAPCNAVYQQNRYRVEDKQICAGGVSGFDSCRGDSGAPLMSELATARTAGASRHYVEGVVSYGPDPCGRAGWPGVYTKIYSYTKWILDQMTN